MTGSPEQAGNRMDYCALPLDSIRMCLNARYVLKLGRGCSALVLGVFCGIAVSACFFHLCQSVMTHIPQLGLKQGHATDLDFSVEVRSLSVKSDFCVDELTSPW